MPDVTARGVLLVALGGALGCVARYLVGAWLTRGAYPWGTLAVNLAGSFAIAVILFAGLAQGGLGPDARLFAVTGVLGGFTTMSAFAYETTAFVDAGQAWRGAGYVLLTVAGCLAMAFLGRALALRLAPSP